VHLFIQRLGSPWLAIARGVEESFFPPAGKFHLPRWKEVEPKSVSGSPAARAKAGSRPAAKGDFPVASK